MINVQETNPFLLPFFKVPVQNWEEKKPKLLGMVDWENKDCMFNEYFTDYYLQFKNEDNRPKYIEDFKQLLKPELNAFISKMEKSPLNRIQKECTMKIQTLWAQKYWKDMSMEPHTHESTGYSAVLYAEFTRHHTPTEFFAPFKNMLDRMDYRHTPDMKEGEIIFFPSLLLHYSMPNKTKVPRTIFSFNCDIIPIR